jgi:hypothetical protein
MEHVRRVRLVMLSVDRLKGKRLFVPARDVGGAVLTELLLAQEFRCPQRLLGEDTEESFNLVQPRRARRSVVKVDARV